MERSTQPEAGQAHSGAASQPSTAPPPSVKPEAPPQEGTLRAGRVYQLNITTLIARRSTNVLSEVSASTFRVPLLCGGATPCPTHQTNVLGWVQLDEHAPRPFLSGRHLNSLLNEDEEMAPGEHTLLAAVLTSDQIHADAVSFRIEPARRGAVNSRAAGPGAQRGAAEPSAAGEPYAPSACFLLLPEPTVNGRGAAALEFLAVLLDAHGIERPVSEQTAHQVVIHYTARGEATTARGSFPQGTSAILERVPRGDVHITVSCEREGKTLASSERMVTLNPELTGVQQ